MSGTLSLNARNALVLHLAEPLGLLPRQTLGPADAVVDVLLEPAGGPVPLDLRSAPLLPVQD